MKKFFVSVIGAIMFCLSVFGLVSCKQESKSGSIDLANCEVGNKLPVYPTCEFDYKIDDNCIVHINHFSATLVRKNSIEENAILEERFNRYEIQVEIGGKIVAPSCTKRHYGSFQFTSNGLGGVSIDNIQNDGTFCESTIVKTSSSSCTEITFIDFKHPSW